MAQHAMIDEHICTSDEVASYSLCFKLETSSDFEVCQPDSIYTAVETEPTLTTVIIAHSLS